MLVGPGERDRPEVARHPERVMELVEFETAFGTVTAGEQALVDAIRELLLAERDAPGAAPEEPLDAAGG